MNMKRILRERVEHDQHWRLNGDFYFYHKNLYFVQWKQGSQNESLHDWTRKPVAEQKAT